MQTLTPELEAILKAKFQAGASGFRGRFEVDIVGRPALVDNANSGTADTLSSWELDAVTAPGDGIGLLAFTQTRPLGTISVPSPWATLVDEIGFAGGGEQYRYAMHFKLPATPASPYHDTFTSSVPCRWGAAQAALRMRVSAVPTNVASASIEHAFPGVANPSIACTLPLPATAGNILIGYSSGTTGAGTDTNTPAFVWPDGWHQFIYLPIEELPDGSGIDPAEVAYKIAEGGETEIEVQIIRSPMRSHVILVAEVAAQAEAADATILQPKAISIDKSLRTTADQAEVELVNEGLALGWGSTSVFQTNARCRIFQWYGDEANAIQTFTGILDRHRDHRDVLTTTVSCRDMMAILIDQTFGATAPQAAGETGAVRTAANGVYLSMEVSAIVEDILDRAGWPAADRDITETSYVLDEYIIDDGRSWADAIIGDEQLSGLVGYSAWADELGIFHFAPTLISQNLTDPETPVYTFRSGEDVLALDDETDQYELRTRIKVRGPLTTTTLQDTWRELWRTGKFNRPVGLWHDPADAANLRVLDRGTKRLYKLRQSDRVVLSSVSVSSIAPHPLGLSGDPADSSVYWILNAPWIDGIGGGNKVKKVRKSDNHVLATFSLPTGNISAIKVSSAYLYYTNLSTDRFYRVNKTTGNVGASYSHTYSSNVQANPSGMMINGTTLYLFWANGGSTARFLLCDESAPGTVTGVVKTAGTALHGGEMDTVTDIDCYGDSDSLGLVAKFTLAEAVSSTNEVYAEVVDTDLEDELGALAQLQSREHDTHPTDPDHAYEVRRMTLDLSVITSLAQATETAQRQLDIASQRRRVVDVGIIGNPVLQKTDPVAVVDPISGLSTGFAVDTYRTSMDAQGTYLGTVALFPIAPVTDEPEDEGDAVDDAPPTATLVLTTFAPTVTAS